MPIDFPDSPTNGQSYSANSKTWTFDGTSWVLLQGEAIIASGSPSRAEAQFDRGRRRSRAVTSFLWHVVVGGDSGPRVPSRI